MVEDDSSQTEVNGATQIADTDDSDVVIPPSPPGTPSQSLIVSYFLRVLLLYTNQINLCIL